MKVEDHLTRVKSMNVPRKGENKTKMLWDTLRFSEFQNSTCFPRIQRYTKYRQVLWNPIAGSE